MPPASAISSTLVLVERSAQQPFGAEAERIADAAEDGRPEQRGQPVDQQEPPNSDAGQTGNDPAYDARAVDVAVGEDEQVGIAPHQPISMCKARLAAHARDQRMVRKPAPDQKQQRVADERAGESDSEDLPELEHFLVGEETAEDRGTLAFRGATEEDCDQPVSGDQPVERIRHPARSPAPSRCSMRSSRAASALMSSRTSISSRCRNSSSFSCNAMISISALRLTS